MTVETVIEGKGNNVHFIKPDAKVMDAIRDLNQKAVGAVVVSKDGKSIVGILSERDIVNALADAGVDCVNWPVSKVMTKNVLTCNLSDNMISIMAMMTEHHIRHVPVLDDGLLVGLISIGDVVKRRLDQVEADSKAMREYISGS